MIKEKKKKKFGKKFFIIFFLILIIFFSIYFYKNYKNNKEELEKTKPYNFENIKIQNFEDFTDYITNYSKTTCETLLYKNIDDKKENQKCKEGVYLKTYGSKDGFSKVKFEDSFYYTKSENLENVSKGDNFKVIKGILLVNTKYKLPEDFNPGFDKFVSNQVDLMSIDAKREKVDLDIYRDFISYEEQKQYRKNSPKFKNSIIYQLYDVPGHNESQIGECIDIISKDEDKNLNEKFKETKEFLWMKKNAHKYGFILRFPENKEDITNYKFTPWHFRFVGVEVAKKIYDKDITLEEFLKK